VFYLCIVCIRYDGIYLAEDFVYMAYLPLADPDIQLGGPISYVPLYLTFIF